MSDRELLELAAKAAGYNTSHPMNARRLQLNPPVEALFVLDGETIVSTAWDPLTDDGHAQRLAVRLQLSVCNEHLSAGVAYCTRGDDEVFDGVLSVNNNPNVIDADYFATRRAIVIAAAEIGRAMP